MVKISLSRDKIDMVVRLFGALKVESQSLRFIIQEATVSLSTAYKVCWFLSLPRDIVQNKLSKYACEIIFFTNVGEIIYNLNQ